MHRPCESTRVEVDKYCKQLKHERTSKWLKDLYKFGKELNDLYPFMCELCSEEGHFNLLVL